MADKHGVHAFEDHDRDLRVGRLEAALKEMQLKLDGVEAVNSIMLSRLQALEHHAEGRNKSSAEKRDMTDDDAVAVLVGEHRAHAHKNAAELLGLTYAQVYSCRLEYTFKHVHKRLRDEQKFKNPWGRK